MSELDGLIGSKISLISQEDVKFNGTLFSINAEESSMVLKDVQCMGTEDRVSDPKKIIPSNSVIIPYVTFPGQEIKDLIVHDSAAEAVKKPLPSPPKKQPTKSNPSNNNNNASANTNSSNAQAKNNVKPPAPGPSNDKVSKSVPSTAVVTTKNNNTKTPNATTSNTNNVSNTSSSSNAISSGAGTGAHLLKLREKKSMDGTSTSVKSNPTGEFDFNAGLNMFKKDDVLAKVATETEVVKEIKYKKDDFFDTLSCDLTDRQEGRNTRLTNSEERTLNQDTFGAIALHNNYRRNYSRGGGRGGNSSGRGGYSNGRNGRGGGRGRGYSNQNAVKA